MKKYIAVEKQTDSGGYIEVVSELVLCKDCMAFDEKKVLCKKKQHDCSQRR